MIITYNEEYRPPSYEESTPQSYEDANWICYEENRPPS